MKISVLAFVFHSIFAVSTCAVNAAELERTSGRTIGRGLRGQEVAGNADPLTGRILEAIRRKAKADNKDQGGGQDDDAVQQQEQGQGEPLSPAPAPHPLGFTWVITPASNQPGSTTTAVPAVPAVPVVPPPTVWISPAPVSATTGTTTPATNLTTVANVTLTAPPSDIIITLTPAPEWNTTTTTGTGPCAQGSEYWNAELYPIWADSVKCTSTATCQEANLLGSCCMATFCFCTGSYGDNAQCVA